MSGQGARAHGGQRSNLEKKDVRQLPGFVSAAAEGKAAPSQAPEQLLPVKFIKHNLFPLILIYFPVKRKHPIVPPPTNL